jgi:hypothetical protein
MKCKTCKWWDWERHDGIYVPAKCRRFPPVKMRDDEPRIGRGIWPLTTEFDWCGEHEPDERARP